MAAAVLCTSRELLDLNDVSWLRYFQVSLFVERKIVHPLISVPCTESLPRLPTQKRSRLLKACGSQLYCSSSPCRQKPQQSSESFDRKAREILLPCLFQVLGWRVLFALCLFWNGVWQKWCQTRQTVSIPLTFSVRQPFERKVRNSQIFCHGNAEFLGSNEKANRPH